VQDASDLRDIDAAGVGQLDCVIAAPENREADFVFELADLPTERRLRHVQPIRRPAEVQLVCNRQQIPEMSELHAMPHGYRTRPNRSWTITLSTPDNRFRTQSFGSR